MACTRPKLPHGFRVNILKNNMGHPIQDEKGNYQLRFTQYTHAPKLRAIVFKGGGGRAWVYRKFLHIVEENGLIDSIKEYGGSSAGGCFAVLASIPFKQKEREKIIDGMAFQKDILDDSRSAKIYKIITAPLYIVSKPLEWLSRIFSFCANHCNKKPLGRIIGWPLNFIAGVLRFASILTHPELIAGIYNLVTKRGIYKGKELEKYLCNAIYRGTIICLERYLNSLTNIKKRCRVITLLSRIPDLIDSIKTDPRTRRLKVKLCTRDITFKHFNQLAKIKELNFKNVFLTATRCKPHPDGRLKIFNHHTDPDVPIHQALRATMSVPLIYKTVKINGIDYMDGGCADNFPIQHSSHNHYCNNFQKKHLRGVDDQDLDVLGVRIEYEKDLGILFEPIRIIKGWWNKLTYRLEKYFYNKSCGMDIYEAEDKCQETIKKRYPLRVLQLFDHGVGFTETDLEDDRRNKILLCEEKRINDFLKAHHNELTYVQNYRSLDEINLKTKRKFLKFLSNKSVATEDIFEAEEGISNDMLRTQIVDQLHKIIRGEQAFSLHKEIHAQLKRASTSSIFTNIDTQEIKSAPEPKSKPSPIKNFLLGGVVGLGLENRSNDRPSHSFSGYYNH